MAPPSRLLWARYLWHKATEAADANFQAYHAGNISIKELFERVLQYTANAKLTFRVGMVGDSMSPTFNKGVGNGKLGDTLLVRSMPPLMRVHKDDVVVLEDPTAREKLLVRRVAALENDEMVSSDPTDEPFRIPKAHCWVLADNQAKSSEEVRDSRQFGALHLSRLIGRAIYYKRSKVEHGPVNNSPNATQEDAPILACELDVDEL